MLINLFAADYAKSPVNLAALYDGGDLFTQAPSDAEAIDLPSCPTPIVAPSRLEGRVPRP